MILSRNRKRRNRFDIRRAVQDLRQQSPEAQQEQARQDEEAQGRQLPVARDARDEISKLTYLFFCSEGRSEKTPVT